MRLKYVYSCETRVALSSKEVAVAVVVVLVVVVVVVVVS